MKHFIWSVYKAASRRAGGENVTVRVYQIKRNVPVIIGSVKWCTASYKGGATEVMEYLVRREVLPKRLIHESGYYQLFGPHFRITEV